RHVALPSHAFAGEIERGAYPAGRRFLDLIERGDGFVELQPVGADRQQTLGVGAPRLAIGGDEAPATLERSWDGVDLICIGGKGCGGGRRLGGNLRRRCRLIGFVVAAPAGAERGERDEGKIACSHSRSLCCSRCTTAGAAFLSPAQRAR